MNNSAMLDLDRTSDLARLLGDPTRVRLVHLLVREELTVAELTDVTRRLDRAWTNRHSSSPDPRSPS